MQLPPSRDRSTQQVAPEPGSRLAGVPWPAGSPAEREVHAETDERAEGDEGEEPEPKEERAPTGTRASAETIHANVRSSGEEELMRPAGQLAFSALAAGLLISFAFLGSAYLAQLGAQGPVRPALAAAGYPLGFVFVVLGRSQLFTEQTLEPVIPLLHDRSLAKLARLLRLWAIVLTANLVGALLIALVIARTPLLESSLHEALMEVARTSTAGGFWRIAYEGVFGGWLVALMAWLVASTRSTGAQVAFVWLATAPIAAFGFAHSIAGSVEAFYRAFAGDATWATMVGDFVVPAVLGNVVGGVLLVALLNHGQVASGKEA